MFTFVRIVVFLAAGATILCTTLYGQAARRILTGSRDSTNQSRGAHLSFSYEQTHMPTFIQPPTTATNAGLSDELIASAFIGRHDYKVVDHDRFGKCLLIDDQLSSCVDDEAIHSEGLVHPAMLMHPFPRRVLVLGNPEGTMVREILRYFTCADIVWAGVDEEMMEFNKKHLPYRYEDPLGIVKKVSGDPLEYLQVIKSAFDVIIVDIKDTTLDAPDLYTLAQTRLLPGGLFAIGAGKIEMENLDTWTAYKSLLPLFKHVYTAAQYRPSHSSMHVYHFATTSDAIPSPARLHPSYINDWLDRRALGEPEFYDSQSHLHMFHLPTWIRDDLAKIKARISPNPSSRSEKHDFAPYLHIEPEAIQDVSIAGGLWTREYYGCDPSILSDDEELAEMVRKGLSFAHAPSHTIKINTQVHSNLHNVTNIKGAAQSDNDESTNSDTIVVTATYEGGHVTLTAFPHLSYAVADTANWNSYVSPWEVLGHIFNELGALKATGYSRSRGVESIKSEAYPDIDSIEFLGDYYINPKVEARTSLTAGTGQYAKEDIFEGEVVFQGPIESSLRTDDEVFGKQDWMDDFLGHMAEQAEHGMFGIYPVS